GRGEKPALERERDRRRDLLEGKPGALAEGPPLESRREPQRIEHELEGQLFLRDDATCEPRVRGGEVAARLARLGRAQDLAALGERELAVGARAGAEVIAEVPVVEVVTALVAGARVGGNLVMRKARRGQPRRALAQHLRGGVLVRQRRRARGKQRPG